MYDVITFVSEVSGFADIFFVVFTYVFALLYTPFLLEAQLHRHMGSCVTVKKKRKVIVPGTDRKGVAEILNEIYNRFSLKLSIWVIIASKILPTRYRSHRATQLYELMEKNQRRIDQALDVRNIVET